MDELSVGDKEVVETLLKFVDKLPTKGLVRVYNSVHPIIDIEGLVVMYHCRAYGAVWKEEFGALSNVEEGNGR